MKLQRIFCLFAAVAAPALAPADEPAPDAKPLATIEAIVDYCARLDPSAAGKYRDLVKSMTQGASEETLARVRKSNEYRQAHGEMDEFLAKVDERNATKVCARRLAQGE